MPPNVSFIILSRRRIVFRSTSKLKLNNQVEIIDSADLRFSLNESNTFFSNNGIQLSSEDLKFIGNEGRKNVTKKFDIETMCQSNLKEYKKLIKS